MESKKILGRGFFPKELIPAFNTEMLENQYDNLKNKVQTYTNRKKGKVISLSIPRLKSSRRKLGIPNPYNYYHLCNEIEDNWQSIYACLEKSSTSISKPIFNDGALDEYLISTSKYSDITIKKILYSISAKYMVYADISRFHGTIYTHSIPWALHNKSVAKLDNSQNLYGNRIDTYVRNSQDKQTLGIPTGPETSFLISEVIASRIDETLERNLESSIKRFRYIDDFYFFCNNLSETEVVISQLTKALSEYELELNPEKTKVEELPIKLEPLWISDLRLYKFSSISRKQSKDIVNYFSKVFSYSKEYEHDFVIKYAINRIKNLKFHKDNWRVYQSLLLQSVLVEPSVIKTVLEILMKYRDSGYEIRKTDIKNTIYSLLDFHCIHNNTYEILWALWTAQSLEININQIYGNKLVKIDNPFVAIMVNHLQEVSLISSNLNNSVWRFHENELGLYGDNWIYVYEAKIKNWLLTDNEFNINCQFYKALETLNVSFFDPSLQIEIEPFEVFEDELIFRMHNIINDIHKKISTDLDSTQEMDDLVEDLNQAYKVVNADLEY